VDIGKITTVAVKTVEGGKDDISAPGQCVAALDLLHRPARREEGQPCRAGRGPLRHFRGKQLAQQHPAAGARVSSTPNAQSWR
jgi:poly(3-hydroxybutyrate) depolymerase